MESMLSALAHPDGTLPRFGDTAEGEAPSPTAMTVRERMRSFPRTGMLAIREGGDHLVIDAGPLGSDAQPGHAHADALSFELSHQHRRVIVDGGAGHYETDGWRAYVRGPFAHNGVSVDGEGGDELWGAFRAGGRAHVAPLSVSREGTFDLVEGRVVAHAGWRWHRRFVFAPGRVLVVVDQVEARPEADVRSHLLFEPSLQPVVGRDGAWMIGSLRLVRLAGGEWRHHRGDDAAIRGFVSPRLGRFVPASALELPAVLVGSVHVAAWALVMNDAVDVSKTADALSVTVDGASLRLPFAIEASRATRTAE
jgi:hypothetical protein